MTDNIVRIEWEGPLSLLEVEGLKGANDIGFYQIYGPHYVYGAHVLLYIGKTEESFGMRIAAHNWRQYERGSEVRVHVGRIVAPIIQAQDSRSRLIDLVETLLIYVHGPGYNASKISDPPSTEELKSLRVFNLRNHGVLLPEISGERWVYQRPMIRAAGAG